MNIAQTNTNLQADPAAPTLRTLGHLQIGTTSDVDLGGSKPRTLIARLLIDVGRPVSTDRLIDAIWADDPPEQAIVSLRTYVSRLRRSLDGIATIHSHEQSYSISIVDSGFDVAVAQRLIEAGRHALAAGDARTACDALSRAVALWRGRPFDEFADEEWAIGESCRLVELHLDAWEDLADARIALGDHRRVVSDLRLLVQLNPLREGLIARLVTALARSGRQADGLAALKRHRNQLVDELGIEPDPKLQRLEHDLLIQAPELMTPSPAGVRSTSTTPNAARSRHGRRAPVRCARHGRASHRPNAA